MPSAEPQDLTPLPLAMQKVLWPCHHINGLGASRQEGMVDLSVHAKNACAEAKHNMFVERGIDDAGGSKAWTEAKHDVCGSIAEQEKTYIHNMFDHGKEMQAKATVAAKTRLERQAKAFAAASKALAIKRPTEMRARMDARMDARLPNRGRHP